MSTKKNQTVEQQIASLKEQIKYAQEQMEWHQQEATSEEISVGELTATLVKLEKKRDE
jgi:hypothetical protein